MNINEPKYMLAVNYTGRRRLCFGAVAAGLLSVLAACASTPKPPTAAIQAAEQAIVNADQERVADYASLELREARDKLNDARAAVREEKMAQALLLAEESEVNAKLALAKADVVKAERVNQDMQDSIVALKQEMERSSGDSK